MTKKDKKLLLKDLCARLPHKVKVNYADEIYDVFGYSGNNLIIVLPFLSNLEAHPIETCKPYLRPMSSITEEEAKTLATLWGIKDFISLDITDEYIGVICDDGFSSTSTTEIWYDGDMSIECFDFLNAHHLDYRGLIPMGLALPAPEGMYKFN